jgi:hypothetical protein
MQSGTDSFGIRGGGGKGVEMIKHPKYITVGGLLTQYYRNPASPPLLFILFSPNLFGFLLSRTLEDAL